MKPARHTQWGLRALIWAAFVLALALVTFNWFVPWLGRQGTLNRIIEGMLQSSLTIPVRIEHVDSQPMSQLTVTRLRSVNARAQERFTFDTRLISIQYDPIELLGGHIRQVTFESPEVFINLDSELSGIAQVPSLPGAAASGSAEEPDQNTLLPFTIDTTTLERGTVTLRLNGRQLTLNNLRIEISRLGQLRGETFFLTLEALGGVLRSSGGLDMLRTPGAPTRYVFHETRVWSDSIDVAELIPLAGCGSGQRFLAESRVTACQGKTCAGGHPGGYLARNSDVEVLHPCE